MRMRFTKSIKIGNYIISEDSPVFIIGEAGVNHNGDMKLAKQLIDIAVKAGVDAVKFQTFKAESLILKNVEKAPYQKVTTSGNESQFDMLKALEVSKEQNLELKKYCEERNIVFLTTPFDEQSLEELDDLDLPAYKIASTDLTNIAFLRRVAKKGKPIFLSTGMSYLAEVERALQAIYPFNNEVVLLQCSANYPLPDEEVNLQVIRTYQQQFDLLVGFSDHTRGIGATPYAVPMGVKVVEKHFTLDKGMSGPDHATSLSPQQLKELVNEIRTVEKFLGNSLKVPTLSEINTRASLQKCLVARKSIGVNEIFSEENLIAMRTGGSGVSALYFDDLIGKPSNREYQKDEVIEFSGFKN